MSRLSIYRSLIFVVAAIILIVLLPHRSDKTLTYDLNKPWAHQLLTAPFDIPIYLDEESRLQKIDSIDRQFVPVFRRDDTTESQILKDIDDIKTLDENQKSSLKAEISRLYENGIIDPKADNIIKSGNLESVRFISGNTLVRKKTSQFITPREAYSSLSSKFGINSRIHAAISAGNIAGKLTPNIYPDSVATEKLYRRELQPVEAAIGVLQKGERIIDRGEIVTPQHFTILKTYEQILKGRGNNDNSLDWKTLAGQIAYILILLSAIYIYLLLYRREIFDEPKKVLSIVVALTGIVAMAAIASKISSSLLFIVPFTILPIMLTVFFDSRTAHFSNIILVLLCSVFANYPFEFIAVQLIAGIAAIFSLRELTKRSQLLQTALAIFVTYAVAYLSIELMTTGTITGDTGRLILYFAGNAVFVSFAYILIFVFEKLFGLTSMVTLVELCDINNPLLRELSEECPGTFQHSISVSNLASWAASRIGANALIVRAGALYHDIGKTVNPAFFTENQHGVNPHDALDPRQSAKIIISHVTDGLRMADEHKLPQMIKDMICQHHGKGLASYFYKTYVNRHPDEEVDTTPFQYPGPNPQTREASILMMADSVEAASRSLDDHSPESIATLVNGIIDSQIAQGLHNESPVSFRDVSRIKESFISRIRSMYHARIAYPK